MSDFLDKVQQFVDGVKANALDLADTFAGALEELAAYVRACGAAVPVGADPTEAARLAACQAELVALVPAAGTVGSVWSDRLVQILLAIIANL